MDETLLSQSQSGKESLDSTTGPAQSVPTGLEALKTVNAPLTAVIYDPSGTEQISQFPRAICSPVSAIHCSNPDQLFDQLSAVKSDHIIIFPIKLSDDLDLNTIGAIIDLLSGSDARKVVWITGVAAQNPPLDLTPLRTLGAEIQWSVPAFLRQKIAQFNQEFGETTQAALAEQMGISPSTLSHHLRRNHGFTDRVWARVCTTLGISPAEREELADLEVHGFSAEERMILEGDIKAALLEIVPNHPDDLNASPPTVSHQLVIDHLISRNPELTNVDRDKLATVVIFVMSENGFEDPRMHLWQSISSLQKEISQIHDRDVESVMRHQMIGNMFEQLALAHYQLELNPHVAQYCLTTRRDHLGQVLHTTDIIDLIVAPGRHSEIAVLAHIESEVRRGNPRWELMDSGSISSTRVQVDTEKIGERIEYIRESDGSIAHRWTVPIINSLNSDKTGKWIRYFDRETEKPLLFTDFRGRSALSDVLEIDHGPHRLATDHLRKHAWDNRLPYVGVEIKKGASSNVDQIVSQLRLQRDAILKHQSEKSGLIPALVSHIEVVVLHDNLKLERAIGKLNQELPFFDYVPAHQLRLGSWGERGSEKMSTFMERLERSTLHEAILLRKFFTRINLEMSAEPTLKDGQSMLEQLLNNRLRSLVTPKFNEGIESPEHVAALFKEDFSLPISEPAPKPLTVRDNARKAMKELAELFGQVAELSLQDLQSVFERNFPGKHYLERGNGLSSLLVFEESLLPDRSTVLETRYRQFRRSERSGYSSAQSELPEALLAKVEKIAGRYAQEILIDLHDPESLQDFVHFLGKKLEEKRLRVDGERDTEERFFTTLMSAHLTGAEELSLQLLQSERHLLTLGAGGLISSLRTRIQQTATDQQAVAREAICVALLKSAAITASLSGNQPEAIEALSAPLKALYQTKTVSGESVLLTRMRFRERLFELFEDIVDTQQRGMHSANTKLGQWATILEELENQLEGLKERTKTSTLHSGIVDSLKDRLTPDLQSLSGEMATLLSAVERLSLDLGGLPEDESSLTQEDLDQPGHGLDSTRYILERKLLQLIEQRPQIASIDPVVLAEYQARMGEVFSNHVARANKQLLPALCGMIHSEIKLIEESLLVASGLQIVKNALHLQKIGEFLAHDYLQTSMRLLLERPAQYWDLYAHRVMSIQQLLSESTNAQATSRFMDWCESQASPTIRTLSAEEFVRALVVAATKDPSDSLLEGRLNSPVLQKFFTHLSSNQFEDAWRILESGRQSTSSTLSRIFALEASNPHLRRVRSDHEFTLHLAYLRLNSAELQRESGIKELRDLTRFIHETGKLTSFISEQKRDEVQHARSILNGLKEKRSAQVQQYLNDLLVASAQLELKRPGMFVRPPDMFDPKRYMGFREYDKASKALLHLAELRSPIQTLYTFAPIEIIEFARYEVAPKQRGSSERYNGERQRKKQRR